MNAIKTSSLVKRYKNVVAVNSLNLTIEQGTLFALLGVNGSGKTTTIRMLSCLTRPTSGDAYLLGDSIISNPQAVKSKINISPQETAVAPNLTVRENLELIARIYGCNRKKVGLKVEEIVVSMGMIDVKDQKARTLSGGWQRRLSIAMAIISNPSILFLDEPTLGLDVLARRELWSVIEKMKGKITILLTTHYMEEAEALSDQIGIMAKGELKAVGTATELMEKTHQPTLQDAFVALATTIKEI